MNPSGARGSNLTVSERSRAECPGPGTATASRPITSPPRARAAARRSIMSRFPSAAAASLPVGHALIPHGPLRWRHCAVAAVGLDLLLLLRREARPHVGRQAAPVAMLPDEGLQIGRRVLRKPLFVLAR